MKQVVKLFREVGDMGLGVYAACAAYFLVLAAAPGMVLVEGLPGPVGEPVKRLLGEVFPAGWKPEGIAEGTPVLGIAAVWSASKGLYGLLKGLRVIYGNTGRRGWLAGRLLCLGYVLTGLALGMAVLPLAQRVIAWGAGLALAAQTAAFAGLYLAASRGKGRVPGALGGAAGASCICLGLTRIYGRVLKMTPGVPLYSAAGGLILAYLWAWTVLLGAFFHSKISGKC